MGHPGALLDVQIQGDAHTLPVRKRRLFLEAHKPMGNGAIWRYSLFSIHRSGFWRLEGGLREDRVPQFAPREAAQSPSLRQAVFFAVFALHGLATDERNLDRRAWPKPVWPRVDRPHVKEITCPAINTARVGGRVTGLRAQAWKQGGRLAVIASRAESICFGSAALQLWCLHPGPAYAPTEA
eukprot:5155450-Amphidinium_carterae.1